MELKVPILKKAGRSILKTDPESFRKWAENLPLVNIDACVGQLEFGLSEMNSVELSSRNRFEYLEMLVEPVMHITGALQKKYLGKKFPLGKEDLNRTKKAIELYLGMATGYKLVVAGLDSAANAGPQIAIPMQRAIRYLSESLIGSYQTYSPHRDGIWSDLHTLYEVSLKHGLQAHQEIDITLQKPALTTVETAYKQIVLLSLASPYRLRQGEIRLVYNLLGRWAPHTRLHAATDRDTIGFFTCHLTSDDPPSYLLLGQRDRLDGDWRILDTSGMAEAANATLAELRDRPFLRNILPGENTLKRLMLAWGVMPERQTARRRQEATIKLVLGLNAIHCFLTKPDSSDTAPEPDSRDAGASIGETRAPDGDDLLYDPTFERPTVIATNRPARATTVNGGGLQNNRFMRGGGNHLLRGAFALGAQGASGGGKQSPAVESWKLVDVSVGGYCLLREGNDVSSAQVGELVALGTGAEDRNDSWKLGVIRWMKFTPERGLILGVQLMASGAIPIHAGLYTDEPVTENRELGVLLPENKTLKQLPSLLLPSMPFRTGCLITLASGGVDKRVMLIRQVENTGSFAQFHFATTSGS
jgi:hypothetical protein